MATHLTSTLTDPLRRILLLGLPSGLVLTTPLALIACGGGNDAVTPVRNPLLDLPPGEVTSTLTRVLIDMPAGLSMPAAHVVGTSGAVAVTANEAMVDVFADGPQLATVVAADGTPLLMGWIGTGRPAISAHSTATVLLHFGLGLPFFGPLTRDMLRDRLETQAAVATFGTQIAAILVADPKALATGSAALIDALGQAAQQLLPPSASAAADRARPLGLKVEPATRLSGLQVVQGDTLNSCFVDNKFVRRAVVIVNREAWVDADGMRHAEPQAPVQVGEVMELPLPSAIDSVSNTVAGWANQYFTPDDPNSFFRSVSETVTLDIAPEAAKRTEYSVVVLMAGKLPVSDAMAFDRLPLSQQAYVRGLDITKNLMFKTLLIDLAGPFFFALLAEKLGEFAKGKSASASRKELMEKFAETLFAILQNQAPDLVQKLADGSTDPWAAFKAIGKALTFDPATGAMSPLLQEALSKLAEFCVARLADAKLRSSMLEVATGLKIGGKGVLGILPVLNIISKFDTVLGLAALARIALDVVRSHQMESWSVIATKAKLRLLPDPFEVDPIGGTFPLHAEIVDNDNDAYGVEKGSFSYDWVCVARFGDLLKRNATAGAGQEKNIFTTSNANATTDFLPNGTTPDGGVADTIKVTVYFEPIGSSKPRELIGTVSTTIIYKKAFSLGIIPLAPTDVPTDSSMGVTAFVKETLPEGSTAAWEWSHTGVGSIEVVPPHSNPNDSSVTFKTTSAGGTATVTARGTFTIPATATTASRIVIVDPVSTTLTVKKGLKTLTVEGYFQLEQGSKPLAVPKCGLDVQGKEVCLLGYLDTWVTYIVPKVANAESYSIRLLNPAGAPLYTYNVPSQYPIGGPVVQDGGGTLRIRFWNRDSPYGSYDGVSDYGITQATQSAGILFRARTGLPRVVAVVTLKP